MVTDREQWSERTAAWLRPLIWSDIPLLGICYGHQLIAHACGGVVGPSPKGSEFGTVTVKTTETARGDKIFGSLPKTFPAHVCHTQSVLELPEGATLLASSQEEPHQAYVIGSTTWGVQFHPEFDVEITAAYIDAFNGHLQEEGKDPEKLSQCIRQTPASRQILRSFVEIVTTYAFKVSGHRLR